MLHSATLTNIVIARDGEATAERSLLASVVLLAVTDACAAPFKQKPTKIRQRRKQRRMRRDAFTAMRFIFDARVSGLETYAEWLDFDVDNFRTKLLAIMRNNGSLPVNGFEPKKRIQFQRNYDMWLALKDLPDAIEQTEKNDDDDDDDES